MTLASLSEELRKARQDRRVSLMDISSSTRISMKFLEAIETGRFSVLPQTYIRAFIREYAESVGLDTEDVMKKYDEILHQESGQTPGASASNDKTERLPDRPSPPSAMSALQKNVLFAAIAVVGVGLTAYLLNTGQSAPNQQPTEVSFDNVVKETEALTQKTVAATPSIPTITPKQDSLRLQMTTRDSVWMSILIDGKRTEEFLFPPNFRKSWTARERFSITMGNAGGASFVLNGKELGMLGKRGAVIRNAIIEDSTLRNR